MPDIGPRTTGSTTEQRILMTSIGVSAVIAVVGVGWGWLAGSQAILFDGAYTALGLVLSWLSLRASRIVAAGPTTDYPFGRESLAPLVIMIQGLALLGTLGYAMASSVLSIVSGGSDVAAGSGMLYGLLTLAAAGGTWLSVRGYGKHSDLVRAEATQWLAGAAMSLGMALAFTFALVIDNTGLEWMARYVDPMLVIVAGLALVRLPLAMVRETVRELLEGAPAESVQAPIRAIVEQISAEVGLDQPRIRMAKLGAKLYLEVDYLVPAGRHDTAFADEVRHALTRELAPQPFDIWLNVDLSTDATWAQ
ncbi:MAG TPA: cation transporter [Propionibacteriaceae bacterium]|nr:cation transporter [Propionibacteriaceae bacterium]